MAKKIITFLDCQNIYHTVKEIWAEYHWPNFCPVKLSKYICSLEPDYSLKETRIYTGVPKINQNLHWHNFWTNKLRALKLKDKNIYIYKGMINKYNNEKGVDVKIAIDIIRLTYEKKFDVGVIFSQDKDLIEAVSMSQQIAFSESRKIEFICAYPFDHYMQNKRGLAHTKWQKITKENYEKCIDDTDYR